MNCNSIMIGIVQITCISVYAEMPEQNFLFLYSVVILIANSASKILLNSFPKFLNKIAMLSWLVMMLSPCRPVVPNPMVATQMRVARILLRVARGSE